MRDLGFAVKPVLVIDAEATEHMPLRHGIGNNEIGNNEHIDVAHLWWQDEVKSARLKVRSVKSEDNLTDIGTKALSHKIIRKHATAMEYVDAQENLESGDVMGLRVDESE